MFRQGRTTVVGAVACALSLTWPAGGLAATNLAQKPGSAGCITETGSSGLCQNGRGLVGSASIALSPDGENAYVASTTWDSVSILSRSSQDGGLTPIDDPSGCFHSLEAVYLDCTAARELGGADDVAVSQDGKSVYVVAFSDDAVVVFDRDPLTGELALSAGADGCFNADGSNDCATARGLDGPRAVIVSPDDESVYVGSSGAGGGIAIFDRNTITGDLSQKAGTAGCLNPSGAEGCATAPPQLLDTRGLAISPDGDSVYAVSRVHAALTIYDRNAEGELSSKAGSAGCIEEAGSSGCQDGTALIDPDATTVSADGKNVYVAASRSDAIAIFDRDPTSGELTQKSGSAGCISNTGASDPMQAATLGACQDGVAMDGIKSIAVLADGSALYATAANSSGVAVFERHADGTLTQRPGSAGCITEAGYEDPALSWTAGTCADGSALLGASRVITSPDSRFAYTAAVGGGVGIFDVVEPPAPPVRPPPVEPAMQSAPLGPSLACRHALADRRVAKRRLRAARGQRRRLSRRARQDGSSKARRAALRNARRRARKWRRRLRGANRRVRDFCVVG